MARLQPIVVGVLDLLVQKAAFGIRRQQGESWRVPALAQRATAFALLAVAILAANTARGDVISFDDVVGHSRFFHDRRHQLDHIARDDVRIDEVFPVKHQCSEVPVLIHAQRRTVERMVESCSALKWADDRFHALMQTNPGDAVARVNVYGHLTTAMEMFVLDLDDPEYENYLQEFWNEDRAGVYLEGVALVGQREGMGESEREYFRNFFLSVEVHEYIHHLQYTFGWLGAPLPIWLEGGATFMQFEYVRSALRNDWYSLATAFDVDGWEVVEERVIPRGLRNGLPELTAFFEPYSEWKDLLEEFTLAEVVYYWGAWIIRFLVERRSQDLSDLKETYEDETGTRAHDLMVHLNDDWHAWHESLATLSVADEPEPITIIKGDHVIVDLGHFFRTINVLAFDISLIDSWPDDDPRGTAPLYLGVVKKLLVLYAVAPATWEFTVTATNVDGDSAELPFIVVVERLEGSEIVIGDPLSTEEGRTVVDLNRYFAGPEDIAFSAQSANAEVATAVVTEEGRLVVTAISPGEAEITVRATAGRQGAERTFTIVVTDECPPWLCRGLFSGWRKLLLQ